MGREEEHSTKAALQRQIIIELCAENNPEEIPLLERFGTHPLLPKFKALRWLYDQECISDSKE